MKRGWEEYILSYAHNRGGGFHVKCLLTHLPQSGKNITNSSIYWYLGQLVKAGKLVRVGRGRYSIATKQVFSISPDLSIVALYSELRRNYPFASFCIYRGSVIAPLQHHLAPNNIIYIETEKEATDAVFNYLQEKGYVVYIKPDREFIYRYVDLSKEAIFVKTLVSESPLQTINEIPMPTLEKLLVDINTDGDFFYLQEAESHYILENAVNLYTINENRLFRYARRRGIGKRIENELRHLTY